MLKALYLELFLPAGPQSSQAMELEDCVAQVGQGFDLSEEQSAEVADMLASVEVDAGLKGEFLTLLAQKGESAAEVAGLAKRYRELARDPDLGEWSERAIDMWHGWR